MGQTVDCLTCFGSNNAHAVFSDVLQAVLLKV
jgi:hypothetical protein